MINQLQQLMGGLGATQYSPYNRENYYPIPAYDTRTDRQYLEDGIRDAQKQIECMEQRIKECKEALEALNANPTYEKIANLMLKLRGRR